MEQKQASENDSRRDSNQERSARRIARLETLRRWMLVIAPILMLGGYAADYLPVLYASALPLAVALLATYLIKWTEENAAKEEENSTA